MLEGDTGVDFLSCLLSLPQKKNPVPSQFQTIVKK